MQYEYLSRMTDAEFTEWLAGEMTADGGLVRLMMARRLRDIKLVTLKHSPPPKPIYQRESHDLTYKPFAPWKPWTPSDI